MARRTTFTLEEDEFIREARAQRPPATWVIIGEELNRPAETCRLHWTNVARHKASYKDVLALRKLGYRPSEVARKLDISPKTVMWWYRRADERVDSRPKYQARTCLTCRETFASEGRHNRVCPSCKNTVNWREGNIAAPYSIGSRG